MNGCQMGFNLSSMRFQERRKCEPLSQGSSIFIDIEAWAIGGDLKEYATRFAEVDRAEVEAVNHRCHGRIDAGDALSPLSVFFLVWGAPCHVMHAANADKTMERLCWIDLHVYLCTCSAWAYLKDRYSRLPRRLIAADTTEAKHFCQKTGRCFEIA